MKTYTKILDAVYEGIRWFVAIVLTVMVILVFTEVVRRYLFGASFMWADELIRFLIMWIGFVGGAAAFRDGSLVCFDLVTTNLNQRMQGILKLLMNVVIFFFLIMLIYFTSKNLMSPGIKNAVGTGFKVSMIFPYAAMPIGFTLMLLYCIDNFRILISALRKEGA